MDGRIGHPGVTTRVRLVGLLAGPGARIWTATTRKAIWSDRRSGLEAELPMVNVPGGHPQGLTQATWRSSPAPEALEDVGSAGAAAHWHPMNQTPTRSVRE